MDRKGRIIAVANMKGGVGKTTTVVSLAEALAADDETKKVLVIDLDPQASASVAIAGDDELDRLLDRGLTLESYLGQALVDHASPNIRDFIHPTVCCTTLRGEQLDVALLPCGPGLRAVERELIFELAKINDDIAATDGHITRLFKKQVLPLAKDYDYVLFDCAPGISPVTEIAIRLSDLVIVPTVPDRISVYGLNAFYQGIWVGSSKHLPKPKAKPSILIVRKNSAIKEHKTVHDSLRAQIERGDGGYSMMQSQIPTSAALVQALMMPGYPTYTMKYTAPVISDILNPLCREVKGML